MTERLLKKSPQKIRIELRRKTNVSQFGDMTQFRKMGNLNSFCLLRCKNGS